MFELLAVFLIVKQILFHLIEQLYALLFMYICLFMYFIPFNIAWIPR